MTSKIICFHSFRGGTGRTTLTISFGVVLSQLKKNVGIVDFDLKAPAMQSMIGLTGDETSWRLNDYLRKRCNTKDVTLVVSEKLGLKNGNLFFTPSSSKIEDIMKIIEEGYEVSLLSRFIHEVSNEFGFDYILLDTHAGIDEDAILAMSISDIVIEVARADIGGLLGLKTSLQVVEKLGKKFYVLLNMVPKGLKDTEIADAELDGRKLGVIPFFNDIWENKSQSLVVVSNPNHAFSVNIMRMIGKLLPEIAFLERKQEKKKPSREESEEKHEPIFY